MRWKHLRWLFVGMTALFSAGCVFLAEDHWAMVVWLAIFASACSWVSYFGGDE